LGIYQLDKWEFITKKTSKVDPDPNPDPDPDPDPTFSFTHLENQQFFETLILSNASYALYSL
jgi:hypothetical protein